MTASTSFFNLVEELVSICRRLKENPEEEELYPAALRIRLPTGTVVFLAHRILRITYVTLLYIASIYKCYSIFGENSATMKLVERNAEA